MASLLLKNIPDDIKKFLLKKQYEAKVEKEITQFSLELTIYKVIRVQMQSENKKS